MISDVIKRRQIRENVKKGIESRNSDGIVGSQLEKTNDDRNALQPINLRNVDTPCYAREDWYQSCFAGPQSSEHDSMNGNVKGGFLQIPLCCNIGSAPRIWPRKAMRRGLAVPNAESMDSRTKNLR